MEWVRGNDRECRGGAEKNGTGDALEVPAVDSPLTQIPMQHIVDA